MKVLAYNTIMYRGLFLVLLLFIFLGVIAVAIGGEDWKAEVTYRYHQLQGRTTKVEISGHAFDVEVAKTAEQRAVGLSGRKALRNNTGMLFVFSEPGLWSFWMKDTLVTLDIIWIDGQTIVDIEERAPASTTDQPPTYQPARPADLAVELAGGAVEQYGLLVGDTVAVKDIDKYRPAP